MHAMLPISKGRPPRELTEAVMEIRATPDATLTWKNASSQARASTLRALLAEQGNLCAYCTRKIDEGTAHVEHYIPQSMGAGSDDPRSVDYNNLLAVCDGFENMSEHLTCDRSRGDTQLHVDPLKPETLEKIRYRRDGRMFSNDSEVNHDLNVTLNLNQRLLVRNRKIALTSLFRKLEQIDRKRGRRSVHSYCAQYVHEHLSNPSVRQPYDGAVIYFMRKRLKTKD